MFSFSSTVIRMSALASVSACILVTPVQAETDTAALEQEARGKIKTFASSLQAALKAGIATGGLGAGIAVCNDEADALAEAASTDGWVVARTSLKTRNPANAADEWEQAQLAQLEAGKAAWLASEKPLQALSTSEIVATAEGEVFRYMQVIPTGDVCLKCHGSELSAEVTEKLQALYPEDQAVGYSLGDIRGAFTLQKPL